MQRDQAIRMAEVAKALGDLVRQQLVRERYTKAAKASDAFVTCPAWTGTAGWLQRDSAGLHGICQNLRRADQAHSGTTERYADGTWFHAA